jgi:hypothetical protein
VQRKFQGLTNRPRRGLKTAALISALLLGAGPVLAQAIRTPYAKIDTGSETRLNQGPQRARQDRAEFVVGNMLFVLLHEMAHVHVTEMGLPVLAREEDAADAYATLALLKMGAARRVRRVAGEARSRQAGVCNPQRLQVIISSQRRTQ